MLHSLYVFTHVISLGVESAGDGVSNVCDLVHIWSYALYKGEERYITFQHTHMHTSSDTHTTN